MATDYQPVEWADGVLRLIDQTLLPGEMKTLEVRSLDEACEAIGSLRVRGAPAIGIAAAYAMALVAADAPAASLPELRSTVDAAAARLIATRPTAVNLRWAVDRVRQQLAAAGSAEELRATALSEAHQIAADEFRSADAIADHGVTLLERLSVRGETALTHCNTGPLAIGAVGTALGILIRAHEAGLVSRVWVDETRPLLQGARLTSWELQRHGVPHDIIVDGAAAAQMARGGIGVVVVGADRIAANGDVANKIGTYGLAVSARYHGIPFVVAAPTSSIDYAIADGSAIPIEERSADEVLAFGGVRVASDGAGAANPAFDVTPATLVSAIVTEQGVARAPLADQLQTFRSSGGA